MASIRESLMPANRHTTQLAILAEWTRRHRDIFNVCARAFGNGNRYFDCLAGSNRDVAAHEAVTNNGHEQCLWTGGNVRDFEAPVRIR